MIRKINKIDKLSILIPVYNYKVIDLVKKVYNQCGKLKIEFEVLVFDDGSKEKFKAENKVLGNLFGVNYMELSENLGRARIRNWLLKSALYDYVLFLDCDSKIKKKDFIKSYLDALGPNKLINGGRIYSKSKPRAKSKLLHWAYGTKYESRPAKLRNKKPVQYFHSNNFAAHRQVLDKNPFNESVVGYGYEDLLMAKELKDEDVIIEHIDNPVIHLGLEKSKDFLTKNLNAVENLVKLDRQGNKLNIRLERTAFEIEDWRLDGMLHKYLSRKEESYKKNLLGENPSLWKFQALKLKKYWDLTKADKSEMDG